MISGISKKVIFLSFLFINFIQPSKSDEISKINKNINNNNIKLTSSILSDIEISSISQNIIPSNISYDDDVNVDFFKKKTD